MFHIREIPLLLMLAAVVSAETPHAITVIDFTPAPGQFANDLMLNDPLAALGWPQSADPNAPGNDSVVSLGGFGGQLTLGFDHPVRDDAANPFGLDAIIFGNALYAGGYPNRRWAECGVIEISRDSNENGLADDGWFLIPGSHIAPTPSQFEQQTWDDNTSDPTYPPDFPDWIPPGRSGVWTTSGYRLPPSFEELTLTNPHGLEAVAEGVWGYADHTPVRGLPQGMSPADFFTRPDNPFVVGITAGAAGGDGIDIAWAVDPATWTPAHLDGFDFLRITVAVNQVFMNPPLGELSTEVDAVVDVAAGTLGDTENDGDIDWTDAGLMLECAAGVDVAIPPSPCRVVDFDQDGDGDLCDWRDFQADFTGTPTTQT